MTTSELHEETLKKKIAELERKGFRVLDLERKCPDAIALKNGKIYAVEILGRKYIKGRGNTKKWTFKAKKAIYSMFDGVLFETFIYPEKNDGQHND